MARKRASLRRALGQRRYRKMFVIATEGEKTEPSYFAIFRDDLVIHVHCVKGDHKSSPKQVLHRMKQHLERNGITKTDEAWLVVDRDTWSEEDLLQLHEWSQEASNRGFALSNPKFEYWLLLHFEDGTEIGTPRGTVPPTATTSAQLRQGRRCSQDDQSYDPPSGQPREGPGLPSVHGLAASVVAHNRLPAGRQHPRFAIGTVGRSRVTGPCPRRGAG